MRVRSLVGDAGGIFCLYKWDRNEEVPNVWLRNFPVRACVGEKPETYPAKAEWVEECPDAAFKKD